MKWLLRINGCFHMPMWKPRGVLLKIYMFRYIGEIPVSSFTTFCVQNERRPPVIFFHCVDPKLPAFSYQKLFWHRLTSPLYNFLVHRPYFILTICSAQFHLSHDMRLMYDSVIHVLISPVLIISLRVSLAIIFPFFFELLSVWLLWPGLSRVF